MQKNKVAYKVGLKRSSLFWPGPDRKILAAQVTTLKVPVSLRNYRKIIEKLSVPFDF